MRRSPTRRNTWYSALWLAAALAFSCPATAHDIPMIDAHSQVDHEVNLDDIVPLLNRAGISRVILAARSKLRPRPFMAFARKHLDRITPSVRTKSGRFVTNHRKFYKMFRAQLAMPEFGAMAEVLVWHAAKGDKASEIIIDLDAPQIQAALRVALKHNWPFIPHIEFASANAQDDYDAFMAKLEGMLRAYPDHPFALTHLGQLSAGEVGRLIAGHGNIHFITSSANPLKVYSSKQPWMDMFDGGRALSPKWRALVVAHPDRFIFAIDNVWVGDWSHDYVAQVAVWRKALAGLPHDVAHAIAHRNAERLWRLAPVSYVEAKS